MNELVSLIAQKTGISEDKAHQAAEVALNFFRSRLPSSVSGHLDSITEAGSAQSITEKAKDSLGGVFGKKTA